MALSFKCKPPSPFNFEETVSIKTIADSHNEETPAMDIQTSTKHDHNDDALRAERNQEAIKLFLADNMGLLPRIPAHRVITDKELTADNQSDDALQESQKQAFKGFLNDGIGLH